jgi:DNA-binding MarR family transcriptional regulator
MLDETLSEHGLSEGEWKVLGHLQLDGPPHRKPVGQLARWGDLSSGAMTNRIGRLEQAGLVRRLPDPDDRRGVLVELTDAGARAWEQSVSAAAALSVKEKQQLNALLRRLMLEFERREAERK